MADLERLHAEVTADAGPAVVQLKLFDEVADEAAEDRTAHINVDADQATRAAGQARDALGRFTSEGERGAASMNLFSGAIGRFNTNFRFMQNMVAILKWPVYITGANLAIQATNALGAAAIGAASALSSMGGIIATLPQGLSVLAQGIGTAKMGFFGIGDAMKAFETAGGGAATTAGKVDTATKKLAGTERQLEQASEAVVEAQERVVEAQEDVARATEEVTEAQTRLNELLAGEAFYEDLADQERKAAQASVSLSRAQNNLADAQRRLNEAMNPAPASAVDLREAELNLADAQEALNRVRQAGAIDVNAMQRAEEELGTQLDDMSELFRVATGDAEDVARAEIAVAKAQERLADLQSKGTVDAEKVADAQLDVQQASLDVAEAEDNQIEILRELNRMYEQGVEGSDDVKRAREQLANATDRLSNTQDRLEDANKGVADAQKNVLYVQQSLADAQQGLTQATGATTAGQDKLAEAMSKLTPVGREFVNFLQNEMKPRLDELRATAQNGLLPGVMDGMRAALPIFDEVKAAVGATSRTLGEMATEAGRMVGSGPFQRDFATIAESNNTIIRNLGTAGLNLADALRNIMVAAAPLTEWLSRMVVHWSGLIKNWAETGRQSGELQGIFERTRHNLNLMFEILGNLAMSFGNVLKAARPLGEWIMQNAKEATQRLQDWTGSVEGQRKMFEFFEAQKPTLSAIAGLVGDLAKMWGRLSTNSDLAPLIQQIREEFLPALEGLLGSASKAFGPAMITALSEFVTLFGTMMGHSGALTNMIQLLGFFAGIINDIVGSNPAVASMSASLFTMFGVVKTFKGVGRIGEMIGLGSLKDEGTGALGVIKRFAGGLKGVGAEGASAGTKLASGFGAAFPNLTKGFQGITSLFTKAGPLGMLMPWGAVAAAAIGAVFLIIKNWDTIKEFFSKAWEKIKEIFDKAIDWLYDAGKAIIEGAWKGITWAWDALLGVFFGERKEAVKDFFKDALDWLFDAGKNILEGAFKGLKWIWDHSIYKWLWDRKDAILGFFRDAINWLFDIGKNILDGLWKGIQWFWDNTFVRVFEIHKWILGKFADVGSWLFQKGKDILEGLWKGFENMRDWFWTQVGKIGGWITGAIGNAFELLKDTGKNIVTGLWNGLDGARGWITDKVKEWAKAILPGPLEKILGIDSPSKLTAGYGKMVAVGLAQGMLSEANQVAKAAVKLGAAAEPVMDHSGTVNGLAAYGGASLANIGAINLQVNVTGASDPKATADAVVGAGQDLIPMLLRELRSR